MMPIIREVKMSKDFLRISLNLLLLTILAGTGLTAQLIPIRTVPVASGDQFLMVPSETLGMGGVTIAVDDPLADGWVNPAKGVFIGESSFIGAPTFYGISDHGGGGKTFPMVGLFQGDAWFGGAALAVQQIDNPEERWGWGPFIEPGVIWDSQPQRLSDVSSRNLYARGFIGRKVDSGPWSVGLGFSTAQLNAVDGVDLLYAGADRIDQSGSASDVRLGLYRSGERDRISLVGVYNKISMTHDVTWTDVIWRGDFDRVATRRIEVNEDKTRTIGGHLNWDRDLEAPGWRIGATATVNQKSHPKIPNYQIQNIPRDPGTTWAYEAGFGIARTRGETTFGVDMVLQPIWSETWQEADERVTTGAGTVIEPGGRTIENEFFFTNVILRTGLSHQLGDLEFQAGLEMRSYDYELEQRNHIEGSFRDLEESWMEWSPTIGAVLHLSDVDLRYTGRFTAGTGRPGIAWEWEEGVMRMMDSANDFIIAPQGPLTLQDALVHTHQLSVRIPVR
jgi:hypothetical protein